MKQNSWPFVINLGNSIIGVSVLAMPFCFKQCGIILGALLLLGSAWLTSVSCNLLMKAAIASKRRSYEFLAFQTFGAAGKLAVEVCIIGLLIGTCIAFYVVIGDLGPLIISKVLHIENNQTLRVSILMILAVTVVTPLGLLRSIESLSNISAISIGFYMVFVFLIFCTSIPNIIEGAWLGKIVLWRTEGVFQSLPIFSMAFGCQTQLFVMYDALQEPSLKQMTQIIKGAISLCTSVYLMVGFFGYIAFYNVEIAGDILMNLKSSLFTELVKFGFVLSIAVSFPLCIFPCRASIHTLLFGHEQKAYHDNIGGGGGSHRIPEGRFRMISLCIIISTFMVGVVVPNVEFVLGMTGATMGSMICYLFPAIMFIRVMSVSSNSKTVSQIVLVLGVIILFASTYTTLYSHDKTKHVAVDAGPNLNKPDMPGDKIKKDVPVPDSPIEGGKDAKPAKKIEPVKDPPKVKVAVPQGDEKRKEPPNPHAPEEKKIQKENKNKQPPAKPVEKPVKKELKTNPPEVKKDTATTEKGVVKEGEKNKTPTKKTDTANVAKNVEAKVQSNLKKQDEILHQLAKQQQEQKKLIAEHKQLIQELKEHKKEHDKEEAVKRGLNSASADLLKDLDFKSVKNKKAAAANVPQPNNQNIDQQKKPLAPQQNVAKQPQIHQPNQQPVQKNVVQQNVGQKPVPQQGVQSSVKKSVQNVGQHPVKNLAQQQQGAKNIFQQPVQKDAEQSVKNAGQQNIQQPVQNMAQQPNQNVARQPVQNAAQQSAQKVAQQPVQSVAQQQVKNVAKQPAQNVAQQPAQNIAQQPVQKVAPQPIQKQPVNVAQPPVKKDVQPPVAQQPPLPVQKVQKAPPQEAVNVAKGKNVEIKQPQNVQNPANALPKAAAAPALNKVVPNDPKEAVKDNLK